MDKNTILDYVTETPGNTNRAVLGDMLDSVGGTGLPAVTSDDNGMVLTVVEGVWDKAAGSGVNALVVGVDIETRTLNKTWNEINDAFPNAYVISNLDDSVLKSQIIEVISNTNVKAQDDYSIIAFVGTSFLKFSTDSANGYPSFNAGGSGGSDIPTS